MRKVNLFTTIFVAIFISVFGLMAAQAKVVKNTDRDTTPWAENKSKNFKKSKGLQILSFDQVAKLNHQKRAQYIGLIRKAALDLDKMQKSFKGLHVVQLDQLNKKNELYAYSDVLEALFGKEAFAQNSDRNKCIYALNESSYPPEQVKDGRAPFQCLLVECDYGKRIKGVKCGWVASGLINKPGVGCLPIEKATNAINKAHASQACWDQRTRLAQENKATVDALVADSDKFYGFPSGTIASTACTSERSGQFMNDLIRRAYSNEAYGQLVKIAYFCQARGGGLPAGLLNYDGVSDALTFKKLEGDWSGLNQVAKDIFASIEDHCTTPLAASVVSDIEKGVNLKKVAKGTSPYEMELNRQEYLKQVKAAGKVPSHANVLEVEECRHAFFAFRDLNNQLKDIAGTFPRIDDGNPPPEVPEGPSNNEIVDIEPTGCSENVARDESQLAQAAARCMPCMIQSHEAKKTGKGDYTPSKKFLSLMSTLALACGDGQVNDSSVNPKLMMDYWMAFGHCSSQTYEWRGTEDKELVAAWGEKSGRPFWKKGKGSKDASTHPDRDNSFSKAYGLSLSTAKKLFCDPSGKTYDYNASSAEKARFIKARREQFNQEKKVVGRDPENSIADNLMSCMNEASENAARFHSGSNMCYGFTSANDVNSNAFQSAQNDWLKDGYPTILNRGGACYIAKQVERYKVGCNGADICYDKNRDGKDDKSGCACGATATFMVYVDPGFNNREYRVRVEARENGQLVPDVARRPNQPSGDNELLAYRDDNACLISAGDARKAAQPAGSSR